MPQTQSMHGTSTDTRTEKVSMEQWENSRITSSIRLAGASPQTFSRQTISAEMITAAAMFPTNKLSLLNR